MVSPDGRGVPERHGHGLKQQDLRIQGGMGLVRA